MIDVNKEVPVLNDLELRAKAPSIFTEKSSKETSKHYTYIPTYKVI